MVVESVPVTGDSVPVKFHESIDALALWLALDARVRAAVATPGRLDTP